ncbi:iron ABC transporter permease [Clostridium paraputrificum]|uniref:FecCD family ABC transporter permease n=1 Tax=Clostridium TaxID=1485 RepID=UPI000C074A02|nr:MULTISPECIES: iron ABC transporter permease [Clostridium]MDB2075372.1 iron ABC transporter permease [Clostridium paraputrificum]MDB2078592.1 iron ABC transporter permease [Clostridium paraputrificum]MDB2093478.1 iron ABC transporter permease [Clostridium paraputrificum]MDU5739474.1 iron ABC transporter permease [Clostridium sp.]MDU5783941.1 iron ABC transporter permease [Clostridium sp.]
MNKKRKMLLWLSLPLAFLVICIGTSIGSSNINIFNIISVIGNKLFSIPLIEGVGSNDVAIIWVVRFPRVLLAFMVGAALSVSGAVMQSILKNPLASPYTLGVSSGASLGVGIYIVLGVSIPFIGNLALPFIGFLSGLLTVIMVILFANRVDRGMSNNTIILSGMVFSLFASAMLTTISALNTHKIEAITMWQMGSFNMRGWSYLLVGVPFFIVGVSIVLRYSREMDILTFGEDGAKAIGVETEKVKKHLLFSTAVLTGSAVALSGTIGFIDLIVPHLVRKIFGPNHKIVIPMCILLGGSFMVLTDLVARTIISPSELPVGAITAIIGAPFFGYLYFSKRSR